MPETDETGTLAALTTAPMRPGRLLWIGVRPVRRGAIATPPSAELVAHTGITGDHFKTDRDGARQVTLIASEGIAAIASFLARDDVTPEMLRRNLLTAGVNLLALKGRRFRIGSALMEWSGDCPPCSLMEQNLGPGGYNAMRGHGGITARIIESGRIAIGDAITRCDADR